MAKKREPEAVNTGAWLNTYADMITLVLTFFILLFAFSQINAKKYADLATALNGNKKTVEVPKDYEPGGDFPGTGGSTSESGADDESNEDLEAEAKESIDALYNILTHYVEENNLSGDVSLARLDDEIFIRFGDKILFDGYSDVLRQSGKEILDILVVGIEQAQKYIESINIAGHTAKVENESAEIDRKLSSGRANEVLLYMENKGILDASKLSAVGYGLYKPIDTNDTTEGRAQNRRVEIYIIRKTQEKSKLEIFYELLKDRESN
jgi:chemotaxis protein MotB